MKITQLIAEWQEYHTKMQGIRPLTIENYSHHLKHFAAEVGEQNIQHLAARDCRRFIMEKSLRSKHLGAGALAAVRSLIRYAIHEGMITTDPTASIDKIIPPRGTRTAAPPDAIEALFREAATHRFRQVREYLPTALALMVYGGLRIAEVAKFTAQDFNPETGQVRIPVGKGGKARSVFLCKEGRDILTQWTQGKAPTDGVGVTRGTLRSMIATLCKKLGIPKITPHQFRHSFASRLVENGVDIHTVQVALGHSNLNTTAIYLHTSDKQLQNAAECASLAHTPEKKKAKPEKKPVAARLEREKPQGKEAAPAKRASVRLDGRTREGEEKKPPKRIQRFRRHGL